MAIIETLQSFLKAEKVQCSKFFLIFVYVRQNSTSNLSFIFIFDIEVLYGTLNF